MSNRTHDMQGRPYLRVGQAIIGRTVYLDRDFTCHKAGPVTLIAGHDGPCFLCKAGTHSLIGQREGNVFIGIYPSNPGL